MAVVVPFNDLRRRLVAEGDRLAATASRVVRSGWYLLGPETEGFERDFAAFCGVAGAVGVANGTDAIELALRSTGCGPGDEVVVAANAGGYATTAVLALGGVPVWADIDPATLLTPPEALVELVGPLTRAIVVTHLYGNVVDVERLRDLLPSDLPIVEDCAQAHGATLHGRRVGSLGDVAAFSFYPTKNLGGMGDGGAVVSDRPDVLDRARRLRQYGWETRYVATVSGGRNSRLDELQAAVLGDLLPGLDAANDRRRTIRDHFREELGEVLAFPVDVVGSRPVAHLCVARHPDRDRLLAELDTLGVAAAVHYPVPDHRQPAWAAVASRHDGLAETERACAEVLSLPCFPELTDDEVDRVVEAVLQVAR